MGRIDCEDVTIVLCLATRSGHTLGRSFCIRRRSGFGRLRVREDGWKSGRSRTRTLRWRLLAYVPANYMQSRSRIVYSSTANILKQDTDPDERKFSSWL